MKRISFFIGLLWLLGAYNAAASVMLDFSGVTETSGYQVGGVSAPIGTDFTVWVTIDDTNAAAGLYPILDVQGSLAGTAFTTSGPWDNEPLHAIQEIGGIYLSNLANITNSSGEIFFVDLRVLGAGVLATDPITWLGTGPLGNGDAFGTPDILVSSNITNVGISTSVPYQGTLLVDSTTVPEPTTLSLIGLGLAGLSFARRRRKTAH